MGYPEPAERNTTWIKPINFNSKCFKCKHFPMIRRQCCKKCNYTFILMGPFICPPCTHIFIIIIIMEDCRESHGNRALGLLLVSQERVLLAKIFAFSAQQSQIKKYGAWRQRLEEIERWLLFSAGAEGNTVGSCLKNYVPAP